MPIDFASLPLREVRKGRALQWDPHALDFSRDLLDWSTLLPIERQVLLSQVLGFLQGERAVAHDLAPLQQALRRERGHMEEEMYLTQQTYEESTHVEFFQRWLDEVVGDSLREEVKTLPFNQSRVIKEILPRAMTALNTDSSPAAQLYAVTVYHQIVEGVLAEVGYQVFYDCLDARSVLPGLRQGIRNIQTDESRHIAFGTYLGRRILSQNPGLKEKFIEWMEELRAPTRDSVDSLFTPYTPPYPFGLDREKMLTLTETLTRRRTDAVLSGAGLDT